MSLPTNCKFTPEHEWVRDDGDVCVVGITDHAQNALGDVVFIDLPAVGQQVCRGEPCGSVESVKAVSDLYAPIGGQVVDVNAALVQRPELVNQEPYGAAWMVKLRATQKGELDSLLDKEAYANLIAAA